MARILIIEDEAPVRVSLKKVCARQGHACLAAASLAEAEDLFSREDVDLVITDINLESSERTGIDFVREIRSQGFLGAAVVITAFGTVDTAVEAMRHGADDFLQKPITLEDMPAQLEKWLGRVRDHRALRAFQQQAEQRERSDELLGESEVWRKTVHLVDRLAAVPLPDADATDTNLPAVLLLGETGVGKGMLARRIHAGASQHAGNHDSRGGARAPFVHVNCAALPPALVEGELFGHERGAFTDARDARPGLFEVADGGSIFLDEISEMPLELQAKLLVVVEQGTFRRVGGTKTRRTRARIIAASNQDLAARADAGDFRRDLFYRLSTFTVTIPPLRERGDDAVLIADRTLEHLARRFGRPGLSLTDDAKRAIKIHRWPGNVRELVNTLERAALLAGQDDIGPEDLGLTTKAAPKQTSGAALAHVNGTTTAHGTAGAIPVDNDGMPVFDLRDGKYTIEAVEASMIRQALREARGNVTKAAKLIGMTRAGMRYRIERDGLESFVAEVSA